MQAVTAQFKQCPFTRDDIVLLVSQMRIDSKYAWATGIGVNDIGISTRYRKVCNAVQHLTQTDQLVALDWLRLCLPAKRTEFTQQVPPEIAYLPTLRHLLRSNFHPGATIDIMAIVDRWHSDQHLPQNLKRMTVRRIIPQLLREKRLRRGELNDYIVQESADVG
jgi:hypothetical protein